MADCHSKWCLAASFASSSQHLGGCLLASAVASETGTACVATTVGSCATCSARMSTDLRGCSESAAVTVPVLAGSTLVAFDRVVSHCLSLGLGIVRFWP